MILKESNIKSIFDNQNKNLIFLVYGPNEGLVRNIIQSLSSIFKTNESADEVALSAKTIDEDPNKIMDEIQTFSMFSNKKIINIDGIKDRHSSIIEDVQNVEFENVILILKSDNLTKSSKLRKLFDSSKNIFSIPCYEDDTRSIMNLVHNFIQNSNLKLDREIKNYLVEFLSNDRSLNQNELEKIYLYQKDRKENLTLEEVRLILNDSTSTSLNKVNESIMYGKTKTASKIINKVFSEGTNSIAIIRSLINYMLRIQQTQIEIKKQKSFEEAIKVLKPPLFWKDKDSFQNHCKAWSLKDIEKNLNLLLSAEFECKSESFLSPMICERYVLNIANQGKKYFRS
tara:strand:+ start:1337 stop:2362 length:1026 start_codon:yes stop_codon:yes gene_type:complete